MFCRVYFFISYDVLYYLQYKYLLWSTCEYCKAYDDSPPLSPPTIPLHYLYKFLIKCPYSSYILYAACTVPVKTSFNIDALLQQVNT